MQIEPSAAAFAATYARGAAQVVWTTLVADLETPVSAFLKTGVDKPLSFLLESVEGGAVRGRYSIIGLDPDVVWRARGDAAEINRAARKDPDAKSDRDAFQPCGEPPLAALRTFIKESRFVLPDSLPPMAAGVFGYLGYDMVRLMEELSPPRPDPIGIPDAILVRPTVVIIFDSVLDTLTVVTPVRPAAGLGAEAALARAVDRLTAIDRGKARPAYARQGAHGRCRRGAADRTAIQHHGGGIPRHGGARQGLHHGRRHLPGGAGAAFRGAVRSAAVRPRPRAAPGQSGAVPVLPRLCGLRGRGLEARKSWYAPATTP